MNGTLERIAEKLGWKKDIFVTADMELFVSVQRALEAARVDFRTKTVFTGYAGSFRGHSVIGSIGERRDKELYYHICVAPKDAEGAQYLIAKCQRGEL